MPSRWWLFPLLLSGAAAAAIALIIVFSAVIVYPTLPSLDALTDYQPKIPLRIYSADGVLIGEFGDERRIFVKIDQVPRPMRDAILAAEDERFYEHGGVDYIGVLRAALSDFVTGGVHQGASTITMQVARNFFLTKEKKIARKFAEVLLAFKIEHSLTKDQILELYINQIYLGQRTYGFAAAAQTYFGRPLNQLSIAEMAVLAGLPKAPSRDNPIINFKHAKLRQLYVLHRMRELNFISDRQFQIAEKQPLIINQDVNNFGVPADYMAEMVRQALYDRFQDNAYEAGFRVYTTLTAADQNAAYAAVRKAAIAYDRRHGYRGAERYVEIDAQPTDQTLEDALEDESDSGDIVPALVLEASPKSLTVYRKGGQIVDISGDGLQFAQRMLSEKAPRNLRLRRGAIIRIQQNAKGHWEVSQLPQVEAALVSIDPQDGAIRALVGGFDFSRNQFNHVTQALRQPGSSFKPFIYSAALEKGFTPATIVDDAPIVFDASQTGSTPWEPKNYDGEFDGPIRLRVALAKSKNLASVRILQAITPQYAQDYATRFGFDPKMNPAYLTMVLGVGSDSPLQMASAYGVFANGGYRVTPYFISRIEDAKGNIIAQAQPARAGETAARSIDARNAFIMTSLLQEVVRSGTGSQALQLGRSDLAGKTGTTSDFVDAWFCGYGTGLVAIAWVGFDNPHTLGNNETGAVAALPMWMDYMGKALKGIPEVAPVMPDGIVVAHIDPVTGLRVSEGGITDYFYQEYLPPETEASAPPLSGAPDKLPDAPKSQLF